MAFDAFDFLCAAVLPDEDGHVVAQSGEFLGVAGHHEAVLREAACEVLGVEVDSGVDDGLRAEHALHAVEEGFQPVLELREGAFAALLDIDDWDEVLLPGVHVAAEVLQLRQGTGVGPEEMIDADRDAYALGSVEVAQVELIHEAGGLGCLDIDELYVLVEGHLFPVDASLIVRYVDALLPGCRVAEDGVQLDDCRQGRVRHRRCGQHVGHGQGVDWLCLRCFLFVGKGCACQQEELQQHDNPSSPAGREWDAFGINARMQNHTIRSPS